MQASSNRQAEGAAASDAAAAEQEEAVLLVFDVLAAAGQQLNGSARWDHSLQHHCGSGTAYHDIFEFTSMAVKASFQNKIGWMHALSTCRKLSS